MKTLKLKEETFFRTFSHETLNAAMQTRDHFDQINYVQPADGILKDYEKVEVLLTDVVGRGVWSRISIEMVMTYLVEKYDDLSVHLVLNKITVPRIEKTI